MGRFIGLLLQLKFMKMEEWFYLFWVKLKSANWFTVFASCPILIISHNSSRCANLDKML